MKLCRRVVIEVVRELTHGLIIMGTPQIFRVENQILYASYRLNIFGETGSANFS